MQKWRMHSFKNCTLFFVEWMSIVCLLFIYKYPLYLHSTVSIKQVKKTFQCYWWKNNRTCFSSYIFSGRKEQVWYFSKKGKVFRSSRTYFTFPQMTKIARHFLQNTCYIKGKIDYLNSMNNNENSKIDW